ncbi:MAG: DUF1330 domain-containing protein [Pelagimonas sp.]|jgi:uncharacterized protein (DUF1330 family)|nr:DUF1330 domain-containing protein [Pelagimonas sp.]
MSIFVIGCVTVNPAEPDAFQHYLDVTSPLLEKAGARVIQQFSLENALIGEKPAEMIMIVEYPDMAAVDGLFQSPEYQAVIPVRNRAFSTYSVSMVS